MTNNRQNVTSKYEEERLRAAEQSQIVYLQGQIDELRRLLKDQSSKYSWVMEQVRKVEASVGQIEGLIDRHRNEINLVVDASRRDISGLRKEVAGALVKIEEGTRPLREMQSQIQQLAEVRKQDRDSIVGWLPRIEDLEQRLATWTAQIRDGDDRYRLLAARIDELAGIDEVVRADVRRVAEDLQVEKQSLRRQAIEAQQLVTDLRPLFDAQLSRIERLEDIRQKIDTIAEQLPDQLSSLDVRLVDQLGEIRRVERLSTERFLMNQERLEEIRNQQDERIVSLAEADDQYLRQTTAWLERIDAWTRELEQRQGRLNIRIEEVAREHSLHLTDLDRRDFQLIETLAGSLKTRLDQLKAEQVERGRSPDGEAS